MSFSDGKFERRPRKRRVNTCFYDDTLDDMDACARFLKCSRAELLEFCFRYWCSSNLDTVERAKVAAGGGS